MRGHHPYRDVLHRSRVKAWPSRCVINDVAFGWPHLWLHELRRDECNAPPSVFRWSSPCSRRSPASATVKLVYSRATTNSIYLADFVAAYTSPAGSKTPKVSHPPSSSPRRGRHNRNDSSSSAPANAGTKQLGKLRATINGHPAGFCANRGKLPISCDQRRAIRAARHIETGSDTQSSGRLARDWGTPVNEQHPNSSISAAA